MAQPKLSKSKLSDDLDQTCPVKVGSSKTATLREGRAKTALVNKGKIAGHGLPATGGKGSKVPTLEIISWNSQPLTYIVRANPLPEQTAFLTPPEFKQQVGFVVYPQGGEIARHIHRQLERHLIGTSEVLVLLKGRCLIDVYNDERELVATRELRVGDVMLMVGGGHGFRMLEDTVFLEIKQGPYTGLDEKERF